MFLKHIISIGRDMGYCLVVEGMEREIKLKIIGDFNILLVQGYYFSPLPVASVGLLLAEQGIHFAR
ncbi:MAG: hypothetical protein LBS77_01105 [Desulfovibrio sp.]|nr:hypothetical protein [Desulfovibrio sp.]